VNLVDSSAWLAFFADERNAEFFAEPISDTDLLLVPTICLHEVFRIMLRSRGEDLALQAAAAMQQGTLVDLTADLALEAAALGIQEKLPLADSIIYAAAKRYDAVIWTQDEHFAGKPQVRYRARPH